ncbi:MAG: exodeoxyribonuclease-1 [Yoonia sp.]
MRGRGLEILNVQKFSSKKYQSAAQTAVQDRWLTNKPSAPWTTKATVEQQLHEIVSGEAPDQSWLEELQDFYRVAITQIRT